MKIEVTDEMVDVAIDAANAVNGPYGAETAVIVRAALEAAVSLIDAEPVAWLGFSELYPSKLFLDRQKAQNWLEDAHPTGRGIAPLYAAPQPSSVKAKPLEWKTSNVGTICASTIRGYAVISERMNGYDLCIDGQYRHKMVDGKLTYFELEEAKSIVQKENEERFMEWVSAGEASSVTIKPLEWKLAPGSSFHYGKGGGNSFSIMPAKDEWRVYGIPGEHDHSAQFPSLDAAKAAAQEYYEARIRSALE